MAFNRSHMHPFVALLFAATQEKMSDALRVSEAKTAITYIRKLQTCRENEVMLLEEFKKYSNQDCEPVDIPSLDSTDDFKSTALMCAAYQGHSRVVEMLLNPPDDIKAANVDHQNTIKNTALMDAATTGHVECVALLLSHNAKIDIRNYQDATALHLATKKQHLDVVRQLVKAKADVNAITASGTSPLLSNLSVTFKKDDPELKEKIRKKNEITATLIYAKAAVDHANLADAKTALMLAAETGNVSSTQLLLLAGANTELKDKNNLTAMDLALNAKRFNLIRLYLEHQIRFPNIGALTTFLSSQDSQKEDVLFCQGMSFFQQQDFKQAEAHCKRAAEKFFPPAIRMLGELAEQRQEMKQAIAHYTHAANLGDVLSPAKLAMIAETSFGIFQNDHHERAHSLSSATITVRRKTENADKIKSAYTYYRESINSLFGFLITHHVSAHLSVKQWSFLISHILSCHYFPNELPRPAYQFALRAAWHAENTTVLGKADEDTAALAEIKHTLATHRAGLFSRTPDNDIAEIEHTEKSVDLITHYADFSGNNIEETRGYLRTRFMRHE